MHVRSLHPEHSEGALRRLSEIQSLSLLPAPTPIEEMSRLRDALGGGPRLFVKRDDAIPFGFGGNKVRKLAIVGADAVASGADTLVTVGGVQSNHARATAALAAKMGLHCSLIINGRQPERPAANALLDALLGAEIEYIPSREERAAASEATMERLREAGRAPYFVPLGASNSLGALGYVRAIGEMLEQMPAPDVIVHAASSGGTLAGLIAGCALHGLPTRVIGVSADDPASEIAAKVGDVVAGVGELLSYDAELPGADAVEVDDRFVGDGYGIPSDASREAQRLIARSEALFVDHTYTAKALAALITYVRAGRFRDDKTLLFWHTGGQVGLFA
jgi:1-aminocyclopropane-1-carboxylate deaminase/D-cysteine desulfhydrase-like pyridoxal-dependent ACC family enzyme